MTTYGPHDALGATARSTPSAATEDWRAMDPLLLMVHLERTHHAYLRTVLPQLTYLANRAVDLVGGVRPEVLVLESCLAELRLDLEPHLAKEERVLFPLVRQLMASEVLPEFHCGSLLNPISVMLRDHDTTTDLLARLRYHSAGFAVHADDHPALQEFVACLGELEADTLLHIDKENNTLFPAVMRREQELSRR